MTDRSEATGVDDGRDDRRRPGGILDRSDIGRSLRPEASPGRTPGAGPPGAEPHWATRQGRRRHGARPAATPRAWSGSPSAGASSPRSSIPGVDRACTRDLGLIVTDGRDVLLRRADDAEHRVESPVEGVPALSAGQHLPAGPLSDREDRLRPPAPGRRPPAHPVPAAEGELERLSPLRAAAPPPGEPGRGQHGLARRAPGRADALRQRGGITPWPWPARPPGSTGSAGFVGASDGWQDLSRHRRLTWDYDRAEDGNVALTGEVDLGACGGAFVLALGFGPIPPRPAIGPSPACSTTSTASRRNTSAAGRTGRRRFDRPEAGAARAAATSTGSARPSCRPTTPRASRARSSPASRPPGARPGATRRRTGAPGAITWSGPATWWSRPAACSRPGRRPRRSACSHYLRATQMADGHWPQNMWVNGTAVLGRASSSARRPSPSCSLDLLRREGRSDPTSCRGTGRWSGGPSRYIVRSGPSTQQDRWENQRGYTPFTLRGRHLRPAGRRRTGRRTGRAGGRRLPPRDGRRLERRHRELALRRPAPSSPAASGSRAITSRSIPPELGRGATPRIGHVELEETPDRRGAIPVTEVVSPDALALVRFGLRRAGRPADRRHGEGRSTPS